MSAPSNSDDVIDSRDVIERIEELEGERDAHNDSEQTNWAQECEDDAEELAALLELQEQAEGYCPDWRHGATLIRDRYFKEFARELAEDLHGSDIRQAAWPLSCIDWDQAASELQQDYTSVEFDGVTYWVR